jgi:hypothetical protein
MRTTILPHRSKNLILEGESMTKEELPKVGR